MTTKLSQKNYFSDNAKILSKQIKVSLDMDYEVSSMDDHSVLGTVLYQLKFSKQLKGFAFRLSGGCNCCR